MIALPDSKLPAYHLGTYGDAAFRRGGSFGSRQTVALSRDASALFVASYPRVLELSARDGLVRRDVGRDGAITERVALASDGALCVRMRGELAWIDPIRGEEVAAIAVRTGYPCALAAAPDRARRVALVSLAAPWDVTIVEALAEPAVVRCDAPAGEAGVAPHAVAFSVDGAELFVAVRAKVHRFDARTGAHRGVVYDDAGHQGPMPLVMDFVVLDAETALVLTLRSALVAVDLASGSARAEVSLGAGPVERLAGPSASGRVLVARKGEARVLDGRTLATLHEIRGDIAFDSAGDALVARGAERGVLVDARGAIHRVDLGTGALEWTQPASYPCLLAWRGARLLVGRYTSAIEEIDLERGESRFVTPPIDGAPLRYDAAHDRVLAQRSPGVLGWVSLRDGQWTALHDAATRLRGLVAAGRLWWFDPKAQRLSSGERAIDLAPCKDAQLLIASPSERRALIAQKSELIVVDLEAGAVLARYRLVGANHAAFVTEDEVVVSGSRGTRWLDALTGAVHAHAPKSGGERAAVAPDGSTVAVLSGVDQVALFTRERPAEVVWFAGASHPCVALFSPDAKRLVVAGAEGVVRVFDVDAALATRAAPKAKRGAR